MPSSISIAILGAGIFAKEAHIPALAALGDTAPVLKAVYSRSEKSAREAAELAAKVLKTSGPPAVYHDEDQSSDLDTLLARPDIDAVIVILPITMQPSVILKALAAGKHVLSEKPMAPDVAQGISLIKTYQDRYKPKGLIWRVAENFEAEPAYREAAAIIRSGKIGKVISFSCTFQVNLDKSSKWYNTPWRTVPDYQGGFVFDGGVHIAAALRIMLPEAMTHLCGFATLNRDYLAPIDTVHAIVQAGSQIRGNLELTWSWPTNTRPAPTSDFIISGMRGWLSVHWITEPVTGKRLLRITVQSVPTEEGNPEEAKKEVIDKPVIGVETELTSFSDAILGRDTLDIGDPLGTLRDVAVIQAALNSNGSMVDLTQLVPNTI
ncbi:hypothetical protein AMATHDRAFT_5806 [Amanita thiersii Skay4041]|uniref:Gfo/Idh/MocA-like oxidoreductase N-terminal domain-containing protein n=1 Tax=Amanita thiersii Skay4041 TaxID=703135 RepID=A0A2A9NL63_9AGAR|nr:hypothetical protein AMATHDRAFT_5806 [Amanita thiersii Skay4041]